MPFGTKSQTLAYLSSRIRTATTLEQLTVRVGDWREDPSSVIAQILAQPWTNGPVIVRSSVSAEDGAAQSLAGRFTSIQNVRSERGLHEAIAAVVESYHEFDSDEEHVLIQPMLQNVVMSGVALSWEAGTSRPYFVINYSESPDTTAVTAGRTNDLEIYYHFREAKIVPQGRLGAVIRLIREVEALTGCAAVDIEFAFCEGDNLPFLLQARPLASASNASAELATQRSDLARTRAKLVETLDRNPLCCGRRSVLGIMPDWNPAEIVGVRPRPLALSLYRDLVTDTTWAQQRWDYGYRDLRGFPLLVDLLGLPYIDVRASFNSFIPAAIPDDDAERLVDYYIDRLIANPSLHDKVEFDIVFSCYTFDLEERLQVLRDHGFDKESRKRLQDALLALTLRVTEATTSPWSRDRDTFATLRHRRLRVARSELPLLARMFWLLEDCRLRGTRPFAGLARAGFIAVQMLDSLVALGVLDADDRRQFVMDLDTISSQMKWDLDRLGRAAFLERYGHLRPGTYDILSPRYDEAPNFYFGAQGRRRGTRGLVEIVTGPSSAEYEPAKIRAITELLRSHGFQRDAEEFLEFLSAAIREREQSKFEFTRNLSDVLAQFTRWGKELGFSLEELSYADIRVVRQCYCTAEEPKSLLEESIKRGQKAHAMTMQTALPPLITAPDDVWGFHLPTATPNFVTSNVATGAVVTELGDQSMDGCIIMLPNADPGYDWIFTRKIAGFITAYGGVNSHMAIRASELDLPAVIGAGEQLFSKWRQAPALRVDCANRLVEILPVVHRHEAYRRHAAR